MLVFSHENGLCKRMDLSRSPFGFWIFTWNISQIDTMPPKLTIINGDKRILTETGSYCIKTSENGKIINTCSDSISPTEFEYKTILKAFKI